MSMSLFKGHTRSQAEPTPIGNQWLSVAVPFLSSRLPKGQEGAYLLILHSALSLEGKQPVTAPRRTFLAWLYQTEKKPDLKLVSATASSH